MARIASVWMPAVAGRDGTAGGRDPVATRKLTATRELTGRLLDASPRVMAAGPGLSRVDARGWGRRGGEEALARRLLEAADAGNPETLDAGTPGASRDVGVGIADTPVAADAGARLAAGGREGVRIVPPGEDRRFLAPLPLELLPLDGKLRSTLRALGLRRIGELAALERRELEARFGPRGVEAHRLARAEDDRRLLPLEPEDLPSASFRMEGAVREVEPLLFVLRRLLDRLRRDLEERGRCAARLELRLVPEEGPARTVEIAPARPTRRPDLLFDLCRAGLRRPAEGGAGQATEGVDGPGLPAPVEAVELRAVETDRPEARQESLFRTPERDPAARAAALSRIRARLGEGVAVRPAPEAAHRPEARNRWSEEGAGGAVEAASPGAAEAAGAAGAAGSGAAAAEAADPLPEEIEPVLRLLSRPLDLAVECGDGGRPAALHLEDGRREVEAAEGPERLSGDWWTGAPYAREYWRVATEAGELLWVFREPGPGAGPEARTRPWGRWRLHGWWD